MKGFSGDHRPNSSTVKLAGGTPVNLSDVHRETGISISHVSRVISGKRNPSTATAIKLARYFDIKVDVLLQELGVM
jgi:transcriptional regulator with XRE-family HTH domain